MTERKTEAEVAEILDGAHDFAPGSTPLPRFPKATAANELPASPYVDTQDPRDPESEAYDPDIDEYDGGTSAARERGDLD